MATTPVVKQVRNITSNSISLTRFPSQNLSLTRLLNSNRVNLSSVSRNSPNLSLTSSQAILSNSNRTKAFPSSTSSVRGITDVSQYRRFKSYFDYGDSGFRLLRHLAHFMNYLAAHIEKLGHLCTVYSKSSLLRVVAMPVLGDFLHSFRDQCYFL